MAETNFSTFEDNKSEELDLAKYIRYILMQSKMIILITLIAFACSVFVYLTSTKVYKITSLLEVESFNQNSLDPTDTLQMMSPLRSSGNLDNLIMLYKSRTNLLKLITDLNLNIQIDGLSDNEIVDIKFFQNIKNENFKGLTCYLLAGPESLKIFSDNGDNLLTESNYGQEIDIFDQFSFNVESINLDDQRLIKIKYTNPVLLYPLFKNRINLITNMEKNTFFRGEGLIEASFLTHDIDLGKKIIDRANKNFISQRVTAKTEKSRAAIEFIDKNLQGFQKIVAQNKNKLKEFREINKSIDLEMETQVVIDTIKSLDASLYEIEVELANASKIYTSNNPVYINLINKKNIFTSQKDDILSKIKFMPREQQEYIDLFNQVEITQKLLAELETRRLGFSILEASTIGDIRVVDNAYMASKVSPNLMAVIFTTFFAFIFSLLIAIVRGVNFLPITNPAEIMDNGIFEPIMGVIPFEDSIEEVDLNSDTSKYKSAIEALIVNIRSLQEDKGNEAKIISLTSPTALNGKSTTSKKLAETLSLLGNKVLLVDADFKRGSLGKSFDVKSISEKTFFDINSSNLESYRIADNFYLIPRVKGLMNSFHFICNAKYPKIFQEIKNNFDYIIFDTAPLLSVADTSAILKLSDINLLVLRHEINKIKEVKLTLDMFSQINVPVNGFIYNAYAKPTGYYGYYSLYRNYAYAYYSDKYLNDSYDYKKEV